MRRSVLANILTLALLTTAPLGAEGQQPGKTPRIGWLGGPSREAAEPFVQAFQGGMKDLGWVEGRNVVIEWRFAGGRAERLADLAAELVRLQVDVIVVPSTPTAVAAKNATRTIPIVTIAVGDPVDLGLGASLARPGGNITGLTSVVNPEIAGKQLDLLKKTVPRVSRVAVLWNPVTAGAALSLREMQVAAPALGVQLQPLEARSPDHLDDAFAAMATQRAGALLVIGDIMFLTHRARLADLAARNRLPAMYTHREYVETGGLMAYGPDLRDIFRRAAAYVDRILKGANPAELPVERPTKFELVVNLKTAKALGLAVPQSVLSGVDEIIR
jgi:putative ABC transport system substrate-binding protein